MLEDSKEEEEGRGEEGEDRGRLSPDGSFPSLHARGPSQPSACLGDDLSYPSQVTANVLSQQHPDLPYVFTITGFEEPLCQLEIQNRFGLYLSSVSPRA